MFEVRTGLRSRSVSQGSWDIRDIYAQLESAPYVFDPRDSLKTGGVLFHGTAADGLEASLDVALEEERFGDSDEGRVRSNDLRFCSSDFRRNSIKRSRRHSKVNTSKSWTLEGGADGAPWLFWS